MNKTTVYLPDDLALDLTAEATATGVSKADLIRRAIREMLQTSDHRAEPVPLPLLTGGGSLSVEEMDETIQSHVRQRAARR